MANSWFPHDATASTDSKILRLRAEYGWEGYALFFATLEWMYQTADAKMEREDMDALALFLAQDRTMIERYIERCIELGLLVDEGGYIFSNRLVAQKKIEAEKSEKAKHAVAIREENKSKRVKRSSDTSDDTSSDTSTSASDDHHTNQMNQPSNEPSTRATRDGLDEKTKPTNDEPTKAELMEVALKNEWADQHYIDKLWDQAMRLSAENRKEFFRKVRVVLNSAKHERTVGLARKVYHEIAGLVNDRGDMERRISPQELEARRIFREEVGQDMSVA